MGIDASAVSTSLPKRFLFQTSGTKALKEISRRVDEWSRSIGFGPFFRSWYPADDVLELCFLPVADPIRFQILGDSIVVDFRSSNIGPGYHAAVLDLLDYLSKKSRLVWRWTDDDGLGGDETGFATHRDFVSLQGSMIEFLKVLLLLRPVPSSAGSAYCLPPGLMPLQSGVACPKGEKTVDWLENLSAAETIWDKEARDFFIWWNRRPNVEFWIDLLRAQLWQTAQWRKPQTDEDRRAAADIEYTFNRVLAHGGSLPKDIAAALAEYRNIQKTDEIPAPVGIGYGKGDVWRNIYSGWKITLPGYLCAHEENGRLIFQHGSLWLGTMAFSVPGHKNDAGAAPNGPWSRKTTRKHGLSYEKSELEYGEHGTCTQTATIHTDHSEGREILALTLASHRSEPFTMFDKWIEGVMYRSGGDPGSQTEPDHKRGGPV